MHSPMRSFLAAASLLSGWLASPSSLATARTITECNEADQATCLSTANRTCYNYDDGTHECGYCAEGFFEYEDECYAIADIGTEGFLLMTKLLEELLPEYVNPDVTTEQRAVRLIAATKVMSFWNSHVPPLPFKLGLNEETFLTDDERKGRLGVLADLAYDEGSYLSVEGNRGKLGRFEYRYAGDDGDPINAESFEVDEFDKEFDDGGDGRERRLASPGPNRPVRRLQDAPVSVDWEESGYTTMVKNQGLCGCCWAVSIAAAVESALMITGQTSRNDPDSKNNLSFQQMVSCDKEEEGCGGGNILRATRYVWEHDDFGNGKMGGLFSYADYPYSDFLGTTTTACQATSKLDSGKNPGAFLNYPKVVNSVNDRSSFQERKERLMSAVAQQPVTAVLKSNCEVLMNYKDGVLTHDSGCECCDTSCIDHAIVIVGYETDDEVPYWKLRNSWGNAWGEEGYFRIAMNDEGCGWGLFGMLAEQALPSDAYKNLEDLPERPGWWETARPWEKALVIVFSICGFCCLCGCLSALWRKFRK